MLQRTFPEFIAVEPNLTASPRLRPLYPSLRATPWFAAYENEKPPQKTHSHRWALWYDNAKLKAPSETWEENLKYIMAVDSVEDFWALFNNVQPPSMLSVRAFDQGRRDAYYLYRSPVNKTPGLGADSLFSERQLFVGQS